MRVEAGSESRAIAVLGAGSGGHCMAADLAIAGHPVILVELPEFAEHLAVVAETKRIRVSGMGRTGSASITDVIFSIPEALTHADLVNVVVPAFGQRRFFEELVPHLEPRHVVVVWAGDFGSLELSTMLKTERPDLSLRIIETNTLPFGTRLTGPGEVHVSVLAPQVLAAELPAEDAQGDDLTIVRRLWPHVLPWHDVISVALSNPNPIVHPPGTLLNIGRIQYSSGAFNLYREGITEAVARVIRGVYDEVSEVASVLGANIVEYQDRDFRTKTSIMGVAFQASFDTDQVIGEIAGPKSIQDRYITEDLPFGLVPIAQLGDRAAVDTPLIDSLICLGSAICGIDFWSQGRNLDCLGLGNVPGPEIIRMIRPESLTAHH